MGTMAVPVHLIVLKWGEDIQTPGYKNLTCGMSSLRGWKLGHLTSLGHLGYAVGSTLSIWKVKS